jgi:hypothetical protein
VLETVSQIIADEAENAAQLKRGSRPFGRRSKIQETSRSLPNMTQQNIFGRVKVGDSS